MKTPKFCKDCKWSEPEESSNWNLRCKNPIVNSKDSWALAHATFHGSNCRDERERGFFSACGMKGKLWEKKDERPRTEGQA